MNAMIRTQWEGTNSHSIPVSSASPSFANVSSDFQMPSNDCAVPTPPEMPPTSCVPMALRMPIGPDAASTGTSQPGAESSVACCVPPPWGSAEAGVPPL